MKNYIHHPFVLFLLLFFSLFLSLSVFAADDLKAGDPAKLFKLQTQEGKEFDLASRKGSWTVLYFFPKAETPGCTKQACSFRDNIKKIRALRTEVYGISTNTVKDQAEFAKAHALNFILLADDKAVVTNVYGSKMPVLNMSKRWTFIIDPDLIIRDISKDVDPITDAQRVATRIAELQKKQ
ncbi:MAG: peroxiredoxin [Bacteriovorax sp.]|nr:peroxiredoxin [Bacteriovorax sp.]